MPGQPVRWGWHPLTDRWAQRLVDDAPVRAGDLVVDAGAGTGALTRPLVALGARVVAVELHPARLGVLRDLAADAEASGGRLRVVRADVRDLRLPRQPFRVVANPPYDGATDLLDRLLASGSRLVAADLVVQTGLARRFAEGRARGAGRWRRTWDVEVGRPLPRTAFVRPPRVDSVVLLVRRR